MFQLTRASDYALRVMARLAELPRGSVVHLPALAYSENVPSHFLSKILQQLVHGGYIRSHRGAVGGYSLELDPSAVTLLEVIEAVEGPIIVNHCLSPDAGCDRSHWCSIHEVCAQAQDNLVQAFRAVTLSEVAAKNQQNRQRAHRRPDTKPFVPSPSA